MMDLVNVNSADKFALESNLATDSLKYLELF